MAGKGGAGGGKGGGGGGDGKKGGGGSQGGVGGGYSAKSGSGSSYGGGVELKNEGMMKAPGADGYKISRAEFEKDPQGFFHALHHGAKRGN